MDLFACGQGTERQSTKLSALMVFSALGYVLYSREGYGYVYGFYVNSPQSAQHCRAGGSSFALAMPRIRGRPRRGAGWYAAESRRKRHQKFAQAIRVARRKRRASATAAPSPPRTYVEEDLSITLPADFSESRMFVVPDNWDPPTRFGHSPIALTSGNLPQPSIAPSETYAACLVEEETPDCTTGEQEQGTSLDSKTRGPEPSRDGLEPKRNSPPSPPLLHPEHLKLIFEVRSLVDDQAFRAMRVSQRLDMLYAAYSKATPRRQCPTCAQPFVLPGNGGNSTE
jgi:hypothetical protein